MKVNSLLQAEMSRDRSVDYFTTKVPLSTWKIQSIDLESYWTIQLGMLHGVGWLAKDRANTDGQQCANKRPFFRPVSLEPRLARAAVNIAAGVNEGYVVDPMCGTGGILIESALTGRPTLGIDFDPVMVEGTQENIDWAQVDAEVKRGDATRFELPNNLAAVVVDPHMEEIPQVMTS